MRIIRNYHWAVFFWFFILFLPAPTNCFGSAYEIVGTFENTITGNTGNPVLVSGDFHVYIDACKWRIRTARRDESLDYVEAGSENYGEIYFLASHSNVTRLAASEIADSNQLAQLEVAFGQITTGWVPHFAAAEQICILWLAYASGCHLQSKTNNLLEPVYWFGGQYFFNKGMALPASWELGQSAPQLPSKVIYFNDGYVRGVNKAQLPVVKRFAAPYENGFTNAIYEVASYTKNADGSEIPNEFSLTIYQPRPGGGSSFDLIVARKFNFKASRVRELSGATNFKPAIPGRTAIKDFRFSRTNGVTQYNYLITNHWPSILEISGDKRLSPAVIPQIGSVAAKADQTIVRKVVLITFGISLVALVWIITKRKENNEKQN